jgi:hypothetical protein
MEYAFKLQINLNKNVNISELEDIIGLSASNLYPTQWDYTLEVGENDEWVDFVTIFHNAIYGKRSDLMKLGITDSDISIWYYYEYKGQCNIEFNPNELTKLAQLGVTLCISCWDSE